MPIDMKISDIDDFVERSILNKWSVLLTGAPGVGKTFKVLEVAKRLEYDVLVEYTSMSDPTDPKGMPFPSKDGTRADLLPIGMMADAFAATKPTVYFLDDIGNAPPAVQTAYMHILQARSIAGRKLPDCVSVIGATNRVSDRSNVYNMGESVKSRFCTIVNVINTADDFIKYAQSKPEKFSIRDISFIRSRPDLLHDFQPTKELINSPCPRTWEYVADFFRAYDPDLPPMPVIAGAIGEGAAAERMGFERIYNELPDTTKIIENPEEADVPDNPAIRYALCGMLGKLANKKTVKNIFTYFERLGGEFSVFAGRDMIGYNPALIATKAFREWIKQHPEITMD